MKKKKEYDFPKVCIYILYVFGCLLFEIWLGWMRASSLYDGSDVTEMVRKMNLQKLCLMTEQNIKRISLKLFLHIIRIRLKHTRSYTKMFKLFIYYSK